MKIKVSVPATSANIGSGFDALGLAVTLYNTVTFEESEVLDISSADGTRIPRGESNLVYRSAKGLFEKVGKQIPPLKITQTNPIPMARGLGSSSACIIAGLLGANRMLGDVLNTQELLTLATSIEGHPDNVAPAILGGAVCSFTPTDSLPQCLRYEVSDRLRFITVIPPYEVHTSEARKVVPQEIPLSTAVWQMGRIAGMTRGLETGDLDLIAAANDDRIQEPYRRRLIPDYNAVRDTCLNGGAKTIWISGSGSTLMAVTDDTIVAKFLQVKLREQFPKCDTHILTCDTEGAQIEYL